MSHETIGILGLGLMGTALAERLLEHGFPVVVWNRTRSKADPLIACGARWSDNPILDCRRVLVSLFDGAAVEAVLTPLLGSAPAGRVILDTTTAAPESAIDIGRDARRTGSTTWTPRSRGRASRRVGETSRSSSAGTVKRMSRAPISGRSLATGCCTSGPVAARPG